MSDYPDTRFWSDNDPRWRDVAESARKELAERRAQIRQEEAVQERAELTKSIRAEIETELQSKMNPTRGLVYQSMQKGA